MKGAGSERHVKVLFQLEQDEDGYPPASVESLWALPKGEGLFQVDNIPFFATGVALGDVVSATPEEGAFCFQAVVHPSGHSTLRLAISEAADVPAVRALFEHKGCSVEQSHLPRLIAVDVPPSVPLESLRLVLDAGREQERWDYEEACLADTPTSSC
ncbi:DUF4265 domain-containing protein [Archangium gephyra]|uniref:DUF4265 domain-containing protein n=1 Tax=Archangium gephyra TaxID=48 RepID=UPI003B7BA197